MFPGRRVGPMPHNERLTPLRAASLRTLGLQSIIIDAKACATRSSR